MPLREYLRGIHDLLASSPHVATFSLSFDERSPKSAFLQGSLAFLDGSSLRFKEFLIANAEIRRVKYAYQKTFPHHKHTPSGIEEAEETTLAAILHEIVDFISPA